MAPIFSDFLVPASLFFIMLGIGMNLDWREFIYIFRQPKMFFIGLASQMLLLPIIAFFIVLVIPMKPVYQVGLMIISACPGGTSSNLLTFLMKGKIALSVSLTTVNSIGVLITVPFLVNFALRYFQGATSEITLPIFKTSLNIFLCVLLPVALGLLLHHFHPKLTNKLEKPLRYFLILILLGIFLGVIITNENLKESINHYLFLYLPGLALNLIGSLAGYSMAKISGAEVKTQFTLAIEVGLQNTALAIFISQGILNEPEMAMVAVVYSSFSFFTTFLWAWIIRSISTKKIHV